MTFSGARLVELGRPAAILGRVGAVSVEPVNGVVQGRPWAHVFKERLKGVQPPVTYRYASASVAMVARCFGVSAALLHGYPRVVLRGSVPIHSCSPMGFDSASAATRGLAARQISSAWVGNGPAITETDPRSSLATSGNSHSGQFAETAAGEIYSSHEMSSVNSIAHMEDNIGR